MKQKSSLEKDKYCVGVGKVLIKCVYAICIVQK